MAALLNSDPVSRSVPFRSRRTADITAAFAALMNFLSVHPSADIVDKNGTTVIEAGSHDLIVAFPDEVLHEAATKMLRNNVGRLPVVSRRDSHRIVGYLGRSNLMTAHLRQLEEEHIPRTKISTAAANRIQYTRVT